MNTLTTPRENRAVTESAPQERAFVSPSVDIFETKEGYLLQAEMPGVNKQGLELTLEGNSLTLIGRRSDQPVQGNPVYRESRPVHYRRVFELDPVIDVSKIKAKVEQGVLMLELPKAEKVKPKKITVAG